MPLVLGITIFGPAVQVACVIFGSSGATVTIAAWQSTLSSTISTGVSRRSPS